ncbi:MAG: cytochrome c oxidase subunit II [Chloroflexi bacterium]|nr:cytochrome c oxidase subunit II [Chloroflexota bacterium]
MERYGIKHFIALVVVILGAVILISGGSLIPEPVEQVTNPDASPLDVEDQTGALIAIVAAIMVAMVIVGGMLLTIFWLANRQVTKAAALEYDPADPLDYRTYGLAMAFIVPAVLAVTAMLIFFLALDLMPVQASEEAKVVDRIFTIEFVSISVIFGLVVGLLIHALFSFRAEPDDDGDGRHIHGNIPIEITWTIIPLIFVLLLGVYTAFQHSEITEAKDNEIGVRVEGFQWGWRFFYPVELFFTPEEFAELDQRQQADIINRGGVFSNELVLLQDQTVRLEMESVDVIHSFWVPEFRVKRDVVPGVLTELRYTPILAGTYRVRCAELCGLNHWQMYANVRVVNQAEYDEWIERTRASLGNPVEAGEQLFQANCITCHSVDGSDNTGPTWLNVIGYEHVMEDGARVFVDYDYIERSIWNPNAQIVEGYDAGIMPQNFDQTISQIQVEQIFAYMCSLSDRADQVPLCVDLLQQAGAETGSPGDEADMTEPAEADGLADDSSEG